LRALRALALLRVHAGDRAGARKLFEAALQAAPADAVTAVRFAQFLASSGPSDTEVSQTGGAALKSAAVVAEPGAFRPAGTASAAAGMSDADDMHRAFQLLQVAAQAATANGETHLALAVYLQKAGGP
ncbi:unnamed protein product, partial [Phaeothamnion confervicola]